jgi:hypothetical protein
MIKYSLKIALITYISLLSCVQAHAWTQQAIIPNSSGSLHVDAAQDKNGNIVALWTAQHNDAIVVQTAQYSAETESWSSIKEIGTSFLQAHVKVGMNQDGTALLVWKNKDHVLQAVVYSGQDWQTWDPVPASLSSDNEIVIDFFTTKAFSTETAITWCSDNGAYALLYDTTTQSWSTVKTLSTKACTNVSQCVDAHGNNAFIWIAKQDAAHYTVSGSYYDASQAWQTWQPYTVEFAQDGFACNAYVSMASSTGITFFTWADSHGIQTTQYNPSASWNEYNPHTVQKTLDIPTYYHMQSATDATGNTIWAWQHLSGISYVTRYNIDTQWQDWKPVGNAVNEQETHIEDMVLLNNTDAVILLSSQENYRRNTLYVSECNSSGYCDTSIALARACLSSHQKALAAHPEGSTTHMMALWPTTYNGIHYIIS